MAERMYVEISEGGGEPKILALGAGPLTIGRHAENKVVIADDLASRFHCVIEKTDEGAMVRDLGSRNGTGVNGVRVKSRALENGDVVQVGKTTLTLIVPGAPAKAVAASKSRKGPATAIIPDDQVMELGDEDLVPAAGASKASNADAHTPSPDVVDPDELEELEAIDEPIAPEPMVEPDADDALLDDLGAMLDDEQEYGDPAGVLRSMAAEMADGGFHEKDILLVNARGSAAHAPDQREDKREIGQAVELFRALLLVCFRSRASDIHIEPKEKDFQIRVRVDGSMVEVVRLRKDLGIKLMAMVKVMADIDIAQRNIVQEGHFSARVPQLKAKSSQRERRRVDYRVSFAPSVFGQKLVLRIQDSQTAPGSIDDLCMPQWMADEMAIVSGLDSGMILAVGPTGSGKTTSLYAMLRSLDVSDRNVVTIEDPVEIQIDGITQLPVDESQGKSFSSLLKSVLRQDPDVILIGEIRDAETARTALQAAITGHLVFSTLHTKDSIGTIFRLLDLGVEPYMLAQGLQTVVAQRLIRQLCPHCKKAVRPNAAQGAKLSEAQGQDVAKIYAPVGCPRCLNTGFSGRRAIFELLSMTDPLRDVIAQGPTLAKINEALGKGKFVRLATVGYGLVAQGVVSFEEVERVVGR